MRLPRQEGPTKALKEMTTLPRKVANILVHGGTRSHVLLSPASVPGVPMRQQILVKIHACPCMFMCARHICAWRASCTRVQSHVRLRTRCASMFMQTWMRACMRALTCRCVHTESCSERQAIHVRLCNLRGQTCGYVLDYVQPFFGVCK